jgi:hypothetical protein
MNREKGKMHYAFIFSSQRLWRVFCFLKSGKWHSTRQIISGAHVCAVNSIMSEIRANGINYEVKREKNIYYYRLI